MTGTATNQWRELMGGAIAFQLDAFQQVATLPNGLWLALLIVLLSGLSLAIGQSVILFINRVKPVRFAFSLLLNAVLFAFSFLFLTFSTWLLCLLPGAPHLPFVTLVKVFGLGYVPLLFGFLKALPYFGYPIGNLLSVWNLLAMVVGFAAIAQLRVGSAFAYVALGWVVKQLLEGTIGAPIAHFGRKLADRVAGVGLASTRQELRDRISAGVRPETPLIAASQTSLPKVRQLIQASGRSAPEAAQSVAQTLSAQPVASTPLTITQQSDPADDPLVQLNHQTHNIPQPLKLALSLFVMAIVLVIILVLMRPIRSGLFGWYTNLQELWRLVFDLVWIGVVAIVFAGMVAPLESLGWWAGWYGDEVDTVSRSIERVQPARKLVDRYVVYLDGIAQSGDRYTPDIEDFLNALQPALPQSVELVQG